MSASEQVDLSKLKIRREEETENNDRPKKRTGLFLYLAGAVFLGLVIILYVNDNFGPEQVVELASVSFISPTQASA